MTSVRGLAFAALAMGRLAFSELPAARREAWLRIFDHYVFQTKGEPVPYLPAGTSRDAGPHDAGACGQPQGLADEDIAAHLSFLGFGRHGRLYGRRLSHTRSGIML